MKLALIRQVSSYIIENYRISKELSYNSRKSRFNSDLLKSMKFKQYLYNEPKMGYIPFYLHNNFKNKVSKMIKSAKNNNSREKFQTPDP